MILLAEYMANIGAAGRGKEHSAGESDPVCCAGEIINAAVAAAFTVPLAELHASTRRGAPVALARQSAMYLAHVALGLSFTEVGRAFRRDRTTAAHACRVIEDRREEAHLDAVLADLEHVLRRDAAPRAMS